MTNLDLIAADAALETAIRPFFQAWWDCVYQSDALGGLFERGDTSAQADEIRKARLRLSEAATALEAAMNITRGRIASAYGVEAEHLTPLCKMLNEMRRAQA